MYDGAFQRIAAGEKSKTVMCTWSHTEKKRRPCSKEEAMVIFGDTIERIQKKNPMMRDDTFLKKFALAIFEEPHVNSERHLHVIIDAPCRTRILSYIAEELMSQGIFVDCRVFSGSSGRVPGIERFLNYCLVPTESKWMVDPSPMLYNCEIPIHITDAADKARKKLIRKPATLDDLFNFLEARPEIKKPADLDRHVSQEISRKDTHEYYHIPFVRLRLLASKHGKEFPSEFASQMNRIRDLYVRPDTPYAAYYEDALSIPCLCPGPARLLTLLQKGILFHDAKEIYECCRFESSRGHLGSYYSHLLRDDFPARQQSLVIIGRMGSGKSLVGSQHLEVYPRDGRIDLRDCFVFSPSMDDTFPFTGVSDMAKFIDLNDFRTSLDSVSTTTLLNLAEGADTKVPQKSGPPKTINARLVLTANYISESSKWKKDDIDALMGNGGRTFGGPLRWCHPLPSQEATNRCRYCSAKFMEWCMQSEESVSARGGIDTSAKRKRIELTPYDAFASQPTSQGFPLADGQVD